MRFPFVETYPRIIYSNPFSETGLADIIKTYLFGEELDGCSLFKRFGNQIPLNFITPMS